MSATERGGGPRLLVHRVLAGAFTHLRGRWQWRMLWLGHTKYVVGVAGVVTDAAGERVLVLRHRYWSAATWGLPGGYMEAGETPEQALAREVAEETGLAIADVRIVDTVWGFRLRAEVHLVARVHGSQDLVVDGGEILQGAFVTAEELPHDLLPAHRRRVLAWAAARGD